MSEQSLGRRLGSLASRTRTVTGLTLRRRATLAVFALATTGYLVLYLWAIGHLAPGLGGWGVFVVAEPLESLFQPALGTFSFRPVARLRLGPLTYLFSLNTVIGLGLAVLVGLNGAMTYLTWAQPQACSVAKSSSGLFAGIPALLSGAACCGPVVFIVLGIQTSGVLLTAFQFLLPVAAVLLLASLVLVARQVDPEAVAATN